MRVMASVVLALLLLATAVLGIQSLAAENEANDREPLPLADGQTAAPVPNRLLSARRLTGEMTNATLERRLFNYLDPLEASIPENSCLVVAQSNGVVVASTRATTPLTPASTLKLVTAYSVLHRFDPDARFVTELLTLDQLVDGVLSGDLWVRGAGDPLLMTDEYAEAFSRQPQKRTPLLSVAQAVSDAGITSIAGRVVGDESRYDTERYNPSWPERYITQNNTGPLTALSVDDGFSEILPAVHAANPPAWAARALIEELGSLGISAVGAGSGTAPPEAIVIASVESLPVREIIAEMLTESDNSTAELLTKEMGTLDGDIGRTADGIAATLATIGELEADISQVALIDGSGLDPTNKVTCELLTNILVVSGSDSPLGQGMAVVGESGTLSHRFPDTPLVGNVRAKTGFINSVTGLAGFVDSSGGEELTFALISNELAVAATEGFELQERVALELYGAPGAPDVSDLQP